MALAEILNIEKLFGTTVDFEKKTIEIKFLFFSVKGVKFPWVKALKNDTSTIENLLTELFLRKRVMWFDLRRENVELCIKSLSDLMTKCDAKARDFELNKKEEDKVYATILKSWATQCNDSIKEFMTAKENENLSRGELEVESYLHANDAIPEIIGTFRARTLPIVSEFINLLPEGNKIKSDSLKVYNEAKDEIIKYYKVNSSTIKDAEWVLSD